MCRCLDILCAIFPVIRHKIFFLNYYYKNIWKKSKRLGFNKRRKQRYRLITVAFDSTLGFPGEGPGFDDLCQGSLRDQYSRETNTQLTRGKREHDRLDRIDRQEAKTEENSDSFNWLESFSTNCCKASCNSKYLPSHVRAFRHSVVASFRASAERKREFVGNRITYDESKVDSLRAEERRQVKYFNLIYFTFN